jgi:cytochrome c553
MEALGYRPENRKARPFSRLRTIPPDPWLPSCNRNKTPDRKILKRMKKIIVMTLLFGAAGLVSASAADAKENWEKVCAKCHGPDGKGDTKMGQKLSIKDLTDAKLQGELKDDQAFKAVKEGIKDNEGKIKMKPAEGLSDDDIKALVAHVRTLKK